MGLRDKINELLGGKPVGSYAPDKESGKDGGDVDKAMATEQVRADIEAQKRAAFDRLSDADGSGSRADPPH